MSLKITAANPHDATALLQASHALMDSLFPKGSCHYLDIDALCKSNVVFYTAYLANQQVGCGALAQYDGYCEVKSMFVDPAARGHGVGSALLNQLETCASDMNYRILRLETGESLKAAIKLYERHGFERCGPFGAYRDDPLSTFMQKMIA